MASIFHPYIHAVDSSELITRLEHHSAEDLHAILHSMSPAPSLSGIYHLYTGSIPSRPPFALSGFSRPTSMNSAVDTYTQYLPFQLLKSDENLRRSVYDEEDEIRGVHPDDLFQDGALRDCSGPLQSGTLSSSEHAQKLAKLHTHRHSHRFCQDGSYSSSTDSLGSHAATISSFLIQDLVVTAGPRRAGSSDASVIGQSTEHEASSPCAAPISSSVTASTAMEDIATPPKKDRVHKLVRNGVTRIFKRKLTAPIIDTIAPRTSGANLLLISVAGIPSDPEIIRNEEPKTPLPLPTVSSSASIFSRKRKTTSATTASTDAKPVPHPSSSSSAFSFFGRTFSLRKGKENIGAAESDIEVVANLRTSRYDFRHSVLRRTASFSGYANYDFTIDPDHARLIRNALRWADGCWD